MLAAMAAVLVSIGVLIVRGGAPQDTLATLLLALVAVLLQVLAVPLPGFGFFSAAYAPCLAMALVSRVGAAAGAFALGAGIVLRTVLTANKRRGGRIFREVLADLVPGLVALAASTLAPKSSALAGQAIVLSLYLPLALKVPEWLMQELDDRVNQVRWYRHRDLIGLQTLGVGLLGPALAILVQNQPWFILWLSPILLGMHQAARIDLLRLEITDRETLERKEQESRTQLHQTRDELQETSQALKDETDERQLLQDLTVSLADSADVGAVLNVIVSTAVQLVHCQSAAVFLPEQEHLFPVRFRSPFSAALKEEPLLKVGEPIVAECWRTGAVTVGSGQRLFPGEVTAVALPLQREGVLYIGRPEREAFSPRERQFLSVIAGAGGLGIQSSQRFEAQQEALEQHARANSHLRVWVERLAYLLEAARALSTGLSAPETLDKLRELLATTIPHRHGAILGGKAGDRGWPDAYWTEERRAQVRAIAAKVSQIRVPLLGEEGESFMACPLVSEKGMIGLVYLGLDPNDAPFTREQLDVLNILAYQAAQTLDNARLHQEVLDTQAQLVQSSKMAAVGQLAAGVAHELNSPLCAVLAGIEMATMAAESGKTQIVLERLQKAEGAGTRCQAIISKLLYYARDSAQGREDADLNQVVRDTLELLGRQLTLDGVQLETRLASELPQITVNCNEIQQVVTNLLVNARDAVLLGETRGIEVKTQGQPDAVCLTVTDQGPGMPLDVLERVFEPFFTTKPVGKGTGLGLSVSREIVNRHGGTLTVQSAPGKGTCFTMFLPI